MHTELRSVAFPIALGATEFFAFPGSTTFVDGVEVCGGQVCGLSITADSARRLAVEVYDAHDANDNRLRSTNREPGQIDLTGDGSVRSGSEVWATALAGGVSLSLAARRARLELVANASSEWWELMTLCQRGMIVRVLPIGGATAADIVLTVCYRPATSTRNRNRNATAAGRAS